MSTPEGTLPHVDLFQPGQRTISASDMNAIIRAARIIEKLSGSGGIATSGGLTGASFVDARPPDDWRWGRIVSEPPNDPNRPAPPPLDSDPRYWVKEVRATATTQSYPLIEMVDLTTLNAFYDMVVNVAEIANGTHNLEPGRIVRFAKMVVDTPGVPQNVAWMYADPGVPLLFVKVLNVPPPARLGPNRWLYTGQVQSIDALGRFRNADPLRQIRFHNSIENYNDGLAIEGNGVDRDTQLYQSINFEYRPLRGEPVVPVTAQIAPTGERIYVTFIPNADDGEC